MYGEVADKFVWNEFGHLSEFESGTKYRSTGGAESMVEGEPTQSVNNETKYSMKLEFRRGGRVVEGARLESVYTVIPYRGFESLSLRQ